jgi:hypothetical protein
LAAAAVAMEQQRFVPVAEEREAIVLRLQVSLLAEVQAQKRL